MQWSSWQLTIYTCTIISKNHAELNVTQIFERNIATNQYYDLWAGISSKSILFRNFLAKIFYYSLEIQLEIRNISKIQLGLVMCSLEIQLEIRNMSKIQLGLVMC